MGMLKNVHNYPSYLSRRHKTEKLNDESFKKKKNKKYREIKKSNVYK